MNRTETRQRLIELGIAGERVPIDGRFDLTKADLTKANLSGAYLRGANLRGANLSGADLSKSGLAVFHSGLWTAFIKKDVIKIGCQYHSTDKWRGFNDDEISKMHPEALDYWKSNKEIILLIAKSLGENK